jgi:glycosyltransferase involved in cell wall biosynthesis
MVKFSVIIPTYKRPEQLRLALQSVMDQKYDESFEVIVVENDPAEDTKNVISYFKAKYDNDKIVHIPIQNDGIIAKSRNAGIRAAKGDFIGFLDDDDTWTFDKMMWCEDHIVEWDADAAYHGMKIDGKDYMPDELNYYKMFEYGNIFIAMSSLVVRRRTFDAIGVFDEDPALATAEDYEWILRMAGVGRYAVRIEMILGECAPGGLGTQNVEKQVRAEEVALRKEFARNDLVGRRGMYVALAYLRGAKRAGKTLLGMKLALKGIAKIIG